MTVDLLTEVPEIWTLLQLKYLHSNHFINLRKSPGRVCSSLHCTVTVNQIFKALISSLHLTDICVYVMVRFFGGFGEDSTHWHHRQFGCTQVYNAIPSGSVRSSGSRDEFMKNVY
jgi:hypothetical protein